MKLSLRLRTFSNHATVMYAKGTDYSILEIVNGRLQYKFDCGSGPGLVSVHSAQVNDGEWHTLSLEVDGNYAKLVLDRVHAASGTAPGTLRTLNLDNSIYFGGHVRQHSSARHGRSLPLANGFRGCMEAISLNGQELPLNTKARRAHAVLEDIVDVAPGCALVPAESCSSNPCTNGGICTSLPNGVCCLFMGAHCEIGISPCASNPCLYGGTCVPRGGDFYCQCRGQYSGQRCLTDVDECVKNPCSNGGQCHNTYGPTNATAPLVSPVSSEQNIYSDIPPQVPVRPISYTPSIPSDSRNNLDRNSFEGSAIPEHPEFSTFNPDSVHGHRKTVAVCSVAPNLPPPPPSNSVSDSDSIQKPNWDYDYDAKVVDLDPCLTKKPVEDSACHPYNTRGSMSEVQSLSSFQSSPATTTDTTGTHLIGCQVFQPSWNPGVPPVWVVESPAPLYSDPSAIDTDYYPGGLPLSEDLPPPPLPEYDTLRPRNLDPPAPSATTSPGVRQRPALPHLYSLNQYLPQHSYPSDAGDGGDADGQASSTSASSSPPSTVGPLRGGFSLDSSALDNISLSLYASTASCSDMSACCEESEVMLSDYDSGEDDPLERLVIPDSQQHTQPPAVQESLEQETELWCLTSGDRSFRRGLVWSGLGLGTWSGSSRSEWNFEKTGGDLEEDPGHAGGTMSLDWPGNASGFPQKSWRKCVGIEKSGPPYSDCCLRDPTPDEAEENGWSFVNVVENDRAKILWDFQIQTDRMVMANQPDIVVVDKEQRRAVVVDVAIPSDGNIRRKEHEKLERYQGLREELEKV
ncbi:hypothetical protein WMY93_005893 [Mugilogobius chulae]|uniref:Uncharacterized protein n=1 Tax=Mugilogobius chulae TaxID=88201 RepID=A0AAW0PI44_9GOBI